MRAFYLHGARDLRAAEIARPQIAADEVLVQIRATGICGSDLHYYMHGRNGDFVPARPFVLGHESAGEIVAAGAGADLLPVGSRVAIDPSHPCRACAHCRQGRYNLCPQMRYFGSAACSPPQDGSFREYVPVHAHNCHLLPAAMDYRQAALLEPLSIAVHGVGQAGGIAGKRVLVTGAGPIGQLLGLVARHYGAAHLAVSDIRPSALDLAAALWADQPVNAADPAAIAAGAGFDVVLEASGAPAAVPARPFVLGHESAGEIVAAGAGADLLPVGSRVAIDPSHPCRACAHCRQGRYNLCPQMRYFGSAACSPPQDGSFREYVPVHAHNCHLLPAAMDYRQAALLEPLSIAVHGVGQAGGIAGKRVLVTGAGPIGQLLGLVARHYGAAHLAVSDIRPSALDLAAALWADQPVNAADPAAIAAGAGFDVVLEASGAPAALQAAYAHCKAGGTIVQLGVQSGPIELPVNLVMQKELTVRGSFRFAHVFPQALDLLARRQLDLAPLISECVSFPDLEAGFAAALQPQTIKVVVDY